MYIFKWLLAPCNSDASQSRKRTAHLRCKWSATSLKRKCSFNAGRSLHFSSFCGIQRVAKMTGSLGQCLRHTRPTAIENSLIFGGLWLWCRLQCLSRARSSAAVSLGSVVQSHAFLCNHSKRAGTGFLLEFSLVVLSSKAKP